MTFSADLNQRAYLRVHPRRTVNKLLAGVQVPGKFPLRSIYTPSLRTYQLFKEHPHPAEHHPLCYIGAST